MPMNTMLLSLPGPPAMSPSRMALAATRTCSTISPADMLRVRPSLPVAQNGQPMPQPTWLEMHRVVRLGYRMSTDSISEPSNRRHNVLTVMPSSATWRVTSVIRVGKNAAAASSRLDAGKSVNSAALTSKCP